MFRENLATYPYISVGNTYGQNLGRAARVFLAALLAVEPAKFEAKSKPKKLSESEQADGVDELNRLARHFDPIMPTQSAELRYLAGSDIQRDQEA